MSNLQYYAYPGVGPIRREQFSYNQAVRIGDRIECAGQGTTVSLSLSPSCTLRSNSQLIHSIGGWDCQSGEMKKELNEEIDEAFKNVDYNLKDAGGKGWPQVFRVNSYHTDMSDEALARMVENFRKWMPDHQPIWTCVGVTKLGIESMRVEIEVSAVDEEGAEAARKARAKQE